MWPLQLHLGISGASAHRCFIENEKFLQNAVVRVSPISISCVRVLLLNNHKIWCYDLQVWVDCGTGMDTSRIKNILPLLGIKHGTLISQTIA